jgi:hypothetical protein
MILMDSHGLPIMSFKMYGAVQSPFQFILDAQYRQTGWALVHGPVVTRAQQQQFVELRRDGYRFVGMSSYLTFPHGYDVGPLDYEMACDAWCHCFRDPGRFLSANVPRALISVSDFADYQRISPDTVAEPPSGERFDVIYLGATESWKHEAKNWPLAARAVPRLCRDLSLCALVIGSPAGDFEPSRSVSFAPALPWPVLLSHLARARFLFVPNITDPSPRIITEALCLDVPILVHREILGGWKYVNRFTGGFFASEADVVTAARAVCNAPVAPRQWFRANYGPYLAGKRLLSLLRSLDSTLTERSFLRISEAVDEAVPAT